MKLLGLMTAGVLAALVSACNSMPLACTADARAGVNLEIRDAITQLPAAEGATITIRDGAYIEQLRPLTGLNAAGATERAGTYSVTVQKPGYKTFEKTGIVVGRDECHVIGVQVKVQLEPNP